MWMTASFATNFTSRKNIQPSCPLNLDILSGMEQKIYKCPMLSIVLTDFIGSIIGGSGGG